MGRFFSDILFIEFFLPIDFCEIAEELGEAIGAGVSEAAALLGCGEGGIANAGVLGDERPVAGHPHLSFAQGGDSERLAAAFARLFESYKFGVVMHHD